MATGFLSLLTAQCSLLTAHCTLLVAACYLQIDKLVQLFESPIFTHVRLKLLEPEQHPSLIKALCGILMLLPQAPALYIDSNLPDPASTCPMPPAVSRPTLSILYCPALSCPALT